jgi:hypothetical protein
LVILVCACGGLQNAALSGTILANDRHDWKIERYALSLPSAYAFDLQPLKEQRPTIAGGPLVLEFPNFRRKRHIPTPCLSASLVRRWEARQSSLTRGSRASFACL